MTTKIITICLAILLLTVGFLQITQLGLEVTRLTSYQVTWYYLQVGTDIPQILRTWF